MYTRSWLQVIVKKNEKLKDGTISKVLILSIAYGIYQSRQFDGKCYACIFSYYYQYGMILQNHQTRKVF